MCTLFYLIRFLKVFFFQMENFWFILPPEPLWVESCVVLPPRNDRKWLKTCQVHPQTFTNSWIIFVLNLWMSQIWKIICFFLETSGNDWKLTKFSQRHVTNSWFFSSWCKLWLNQHSTYMYICIVVTYIIYDELLNVCKFWLFVMYMLYHINDLLERYAKSQHQRMRFI